jgi:hypothetical protein
LEMTWRFTGEESVRVVLLSVSPVPDSITEFLFLPANNTVFREKRNQLMDEWKTRKALLEVSIPIIEHHQYGASFALIEQIMERFEVNQIIVPYSFQSSDKLIERDALKSLRKSGCKLMLMPDRSGAMEMKINHSQSVGQFIEELEKVEQ